MRIGLLSVLAIVLGLAAGSAVGFARVWLIPWNDQTAQVALAPPGATLPNGPQPRVAVDNPNYDFGTLDTDVHGEHTFLFTNKGQAPLTLGKGTTTCSCVLSDLAKAELTPGESTKIVLQFKSKGRIGDYRQSGTILTNDPASPRVTLTITGRFTAAIKVEPTELALGTLASNEPIDQSVRIYSYLAEPFKLTGFTLLTPSPEGKIDVQFSPLAAKDIAAEKDARSGYVARIRVKPGLPLGTFRQTISIRTNLEKRPAIDIPIEGVVTSDLSVFGPGWSEERNLLQLGDVSRQTGIRRTLLIIARGPASREVKFTAVKVAPPAMKVEIGATTSLGGATATQTPLTIEIPPGTPPMDYLGQGRGITGEIILQTGHPGVPRLRVRVAFAVEG